jgi:acyl dehydratase
VISSRVVIGDIYEGRSHSTSGRMVFMREDKEYRNQRHELVSVVRWTRVFLESPPQPDTPPSVPVVERRLSPAAMHPTRVYFDDVEEGMAIPSMEKRVTMTTIAKWAGATGDVGTPHLDHEFAQKEYGLPGVVAHGALSGAYLAQLVTNWIGGEGALKKHSTRYRGSTYPKDILTFSGKVVRKWAEEGETLVECETRAENQHGAAVTLGKSIASLPARDPAASRVFGPGADPA